MTLGTTPKRADPTGQRVRSSPNPRQWSSQVLIEPTDLVGIGRNRRLLGATHEHPSPVITTPPSRSRLAVARWLLITVAFGLASRRFPDALPRIVSRYAGDVLWAAMVYWWLALLWPRAPVTRLAASALGIAIAVEMSQLLHAPWLNAVRANAFGALVLGQGFLWSDITCYITGVALAVLIDRNAVARTNAAPDNAALSRDS